MRKPPGLAGVTFIDCAGVGALVAARDATIDAGCALRVSHPQPIVRRVLDLTGLLGILTVPVDPSPPTNLPGVIAAA